MNRSVSSTVLSAMKTQLQCGLHVLYHVNRVFQDLSLYCNDTPKIQGVGTRTEEAHLHTNAEPKVFSFMYQENATLYTSETDKSSFYVEPRMAQCRPHRRAGIMKTPVRVPPRVPGGEASRNLSPIIYYKLWF